MIYLVRWSNGIMCVYNIPCDFSQFLNAGRLVSSAQF